MIEGIFITNRSLSNYISRYPVTVCGPCGGGNCETTVASHQQGENHEQEY